MCKIWTKNSQPFGENVQKMPACVSADGGYFAHMIRTGWSRLIWPSNFVKVGANWTRKLCYRKDDRAMSPIHGCPENFRDSLTTPTATIPNIFHGLLFGSTLWMILQNLKSVALSVPQIIGGTPKIWTVPGYALTPFSRKFLIGFYLDWPYKCTRQIYSP